MHQRITDDALKFYTKKLGTGFELSGDEPEFFVLDLYDAREQIKRIQSVVKYWQDLHYKLGLKRDALADEVDMQRKALEEVTAALLECQKKMQKYEKV